MARRKRTAPVTGVVVIHTDACPSKGWNDPACVCQPGYRGQVWDKVTRRTQVQTFPTPQAAKRWREDRYAALRAGTERVVEGLTLRTLAVEFFERVAAGTVLADGRHHYKPATVRSYERDWRTRVEPRFGHLKVRELRTEHIDEWVAELVTTSGLAPSTIQNTITALRVLLNYGRRTGRLHGPNPCDGVQAPSGQVLERSIVAPEVAKALIDALPLVQDRAVWATAFFAGLRRGELMALGWEQVDLAARRLHVVRAFDQYVKRDDPDHKVLAWPVTGRGAYVGVKSKAGERTLPVPQLLMPYLAEQRLATGGQGLLFPGEKAEVFAPGMLAERAKKAWTAGGLPYVTLHECRHTYASILIEAGYNPKKGATYMGHSKVEVFWDRYGHLYPDAMAEDMGLLDDHLAERLAR